MLNDNYNVYAKNNMKIHLYRFTFVPIYICKYFVNSDRIGSV